MPKPRRALASACLFACLLPCAVAQAADTQSITLAVGAGVQRLPSWVGARTQRNEAIPYVDFEWPDHVSFSTLDGLQVDLLGGTVLHGGVYGNIQWGRESDDLGSLRHRIAPLSPRLKLGGYLEWQLTHNVDVGSDLSHDTDGAGAYLEFYAEWDLPTISLLQHSLELHWQAMNAPAMNRFFGIAPAAASALDTRAWRPGAGGELASLEYDAFVPTSKHTGLALSLNYGRLLGPAGGSPLVTEFGSRMQLTESLAFVYHP